MRTFNERFIDAFNELSESEQVCIFNEYAYRIGEEPIEDMDCFDDLMYGWKPLDIALRVHFGDFNPNHTYFRFDGYGNLESTEFVNWWLEDYVDDLADWYEDNQDVLTSVCPDIEIDEDEDEEPEGEE